MYINQPFESEDWRDFLPYESQWIGERGRYVNDYELAFEGNGVLQHDTPAGTNLTHLMQFTLPPQDVVFLRFYRRFSPGYRFDFNVKGLGLYAHDGSHSAGEKPDGTDKFSCRVAFLSRGNAIAEPCLYSYNPNQPNIWGELFLQNIGTPVLVTGGDWHEYQFMLKANTPGLADGELALWIDGVKKAEYTGLRFRDILELRINQLDISAYYGSSYEGTTAPQDQTTWDDNLTISSTGYIDNTTGGAMSVITDLQGVVENLESKATELRAIADGIDGNIVAIQMIVDELESVDDAMDAAADIIAAD